MRYRARTLAAAAVLSLVALGCAKLYEVRTRPAPRATLTGFRTFQLLPTPERRGGEWLSADYDPMVSRSIANRALRGSVQRAFEERGYTDVDQAPDFVVSVYGRALDKLDLMQWPSGYPYSPAWWWEGMTSRTAAYDEGTVLVDVLDPVSFDLLWRGSAKATLGPDGQENTKQLQRAAAAIVARFPRANARSISKR